MSIRFAGSRCVDERRRRRLAQEAEPESSPERRPAPRARTAHRKVAETESPARRSSSPVESLLRPQLWFYVLLAVLAAGLSAGAIRLGWHVDTFHPSLSPSLGLEGGLLGRALVACHFLLGAQLGYVILWYRARSRKDFRGQYMLWRWVEPAWLLLAVASAIDGRFLIQELVLPRVSERIWHIETLCWMAPAAILVLTATRFLLYDMREDRLGVGFVVVSGLGAAFAALTVLCDPLMKVDPGLLHVLQQTGIHAWSLGALLSMLFHARYVIHVTNEAPRPTPGRIVALLRGLVPKLPRLRRAAADRESAGDVERAQEGSPREPDAPEADSGKPAADAGKPTETRRRVDAAEEKPSDPAPPRAPAAKRAAPETPPATDVPVKPVPAAASSDDESESERGLSKKERRRLRKQRRQKQRAQQARL
jgi:hypothetical protein